jgi:hypothetical protein
MAAVSVAKTGVGQAGAKNQGGEEQTCGWNNSARHSNAPEKAVMVPIVRLIWAVYLAIRGTHHPQASLPE